MKRILFIIDHLGQGGAQKMLLLLSKGLQARGDYNVRVASLQPPALYSPFFTEVGIPVRHGSIHLNGSPVKLAAMTGTLIRKLPDIARTFSGLRQEIRDYRPQLVNSFLFGSEIFGCLATRPGKVKIVNAVRATNIWKRPWHKLLGAATYPRVDYFTANATPTRAFMVQREGIPESKIRVIPNGVEIPAPRDTAAETRQRFNIPPQTRWLVAAGRLDPQKGFPDLIKAMEILRKNSPSPCQLSIFGEGPQRQELENQLVEAELEKQVRLEGYYAPLTEIFQAADMCILSSIYEGMPNVILEAMAVKCPVIATAIDGIRDIVTDQHSGLLVAPGHPEELASAIRTMLSKPELAEKLVMQAFCDVSEKFTIEAMVEGYHQLYTELLL